MVQCKELLKILSGKYKHLIRNVKELIAKRCTQKAGIIFEFFKKMRESIIFKPKDVEELTQILQMMENIPQDLSSF